MQTTSSLASSARATRTSPATTSTDGQASFICHVVNRADHGTHSVFIGEVRAAHTAEIVDPLVYVDGRYLEPAHKEVGDAAI